MKKIFKIFLSVSFCLSVMLSVISPALATSTQEISEKELKDKIIVEQLKKEMEDSQKSYQQQELRLDSQLNAYHNQAVEGLTKELVRIQWRNGVIALVLAGFELTPRFLSHSLNDNPENLSYPAGSQYSEIVRNSTEFKSLIAKFKSKLPSNGDYYSEQPHLILNSTKDLYLSLNKASVLIAAEKVNGSWKIYTRIHDKYDFEYANYNSSNGVPASFVTLVNNYAVASQQLGAIVPYHISFYMQDTK
ncbi:hypothetical protein [Paenibacillus agilis]|uniref:Uncharacterized protein n=1 Tax=Paenibacillus agilis TaxID=3020863 RepID=A0A559IKH4_9BACL|nr:hypothetical protein [Paenibacillus agilis]TVX88162.1 hypothetical protein FPZ44_19850 [Paenibacillus agilis]